VFQLFHFISPFALRNEFSQPLVTEFDSTQELSFSKKMFEFDLPSVKKEQFLEKISSNFSFNCIGQDIFNGFCVWFDVEFVGSQKSLIISTSPSTEQTHWAQTLFVFENQTELLYQDDLIEGAIELTRNSNVFRCLDVRISFKTIPKDHQNNSQKYDKVFQLKY
jgi:histone-arginine methyltransferase CARM1